MSSRTRCLITAAFACHLLVSPPLVTSQLLAANSAQNAAQDISAAKSLKQEEVTITALDQENQASMYKLSGNAKIEYGTYVLQADQISYNSDTGDATAEGHVMLDGGFNDEHIEANRGTYNIRSESGRFEHVRGSIGAHPRGNRLILTSPNPFFFSARVVEKTAPDHYKVIDGTVTTCELPHPNWQFNAHKIVVDVGGTAKVYNTSFGLRGVPVLYLPFATVPAQRLPRQSGFLIPNIGTSSIKGEILGESFFWAINRSMDAHIGAEYFSKRGWAPQGEFRARPSQRSYLDVNYFQVFDRGYGNPHVTQGGEEIRLTGEDDFGHNFRGVADVDYLSSFVFRLAFNEVFTQAVNSEVTSDAFLSNTSRGYFLNVFMQRYQDFESTIPGQVITILHAPSIDSNGVDQQIANTPFYWSYDAALEGLSRSEPGFSTAPLLARLDLNPEISMPLRYAGWSLRPSFSVRDTTYTQELIPSTSGARTASSQAITRKALEGSVELRPPAVGRVFDRPLFGRKWKHVIEPRVQYNYVTGVDNFANVLRFDERDILTNTNEVEYALVNRIYSKRVTPKQKCGEPGMPALFVGGPIPHSSVPWIRQSQPTESPCNTGTAAHEFITWELRQKYFLDPTFGGVLLPGRNNLFTSTIDLTGIGFLSQPRHLSPLISRLRVQSSSNTDMEWDVDYDFKQSQLNASTAMVNYHVGPFTLGGGDALLHVPPEAGFENPTPVAQHFNQFRLLAGYGHTNKPGFSAATNIGFDANLNFLQYAALQTTYNWQCCGVNLEFRRFALGSVRNENQYRFTFALANLGSLGNLRRPERLF